MARLKPCPDAIHGRLQLLLAGDGFAEPEFPRFAASAHGEVVNEQLDMNGIDERSEAERQRLNFDRADVVRFREILAELLGRLTGHVGADLPLSR